MHKLGKLGILAACISLGFIVINYLSKENHSPTDTITIGLQSGYPPFEYRDDNGEIIGFDIDVAKEIASKLNKKLVVKDMEFEGEILSLKQGKIDLIISGMNITPKREEEIFMVPYHGDTDSSLSLVFWEKIPSEITSLKDLEKFPQLKICVGAATTAEAYLNKFPNIKFSSFDGSLACLMDVKYGKSVATLVESDVGEYLQKEHPQAKLVKVPLLNNETISGCGIGINKKNEALPLQISEIIEDLKASGKLKQLEDKWFKNES
jgi:ABC-type amino acid transport substrate-binding protein